MDAIPTSFDEFYRRYRNYVYYFVQKKMGNRQDVDDVVSDIMLRFYERNIIEFYDPEFCEGSTFEGYLRASVLLYIRGKQKGRNIYTSHYLTVFDKPAPDGDGTVGEYLTAPRFDNPSQSLEYIETIRELRAQAATYPDFKTARVTMLRFFDILIAILEMYGELNKEALDHFHELMPEISRDAVNQRRQRLVKHLLSARNQKVN